MKKYIRWVLLLGGLFSMAGCIPEDEEVYPSENVLNMMEQNETGASSHSSSRRSTSTATEQFVFQSLQGDDPLILTVKQAKLTTSKYPTNQYLAVAIYKTDCEECREQAPYFNEMARELSDFGIDFIAIFTDIFEDTPKKRVPWMSDLSRVDVYANAQEGLSCGDVCKQIFAPLATEPFVGTFYLVDKENFWKTRRGFRITEPAPDYGYLNWILIQAGSFLNLHSITFGAQVDASETETHSTSVE